MDRSREGGAGRLAQSEGASGGQEPAPGDVDEGMEGHAGLQSAERHEMEVIGQEEEEVERKADQAEREEEAGEQR